MGDKNNPFNDEAWEQEEIEDGILGEFLAVPSAASSASSSAVSNPNPSFESNKKSKKKEKRHSTDDSTRNCPLCHRKPCDYITKDALAVTKKPMPDRWLDQTSSGDSAGAVVVNRHPPPAPTVAQTYRPRLTMEPAGHEMFQRSGNVFGTQSPLVPTLPRENFSGLFHEPWSEQDTREQAFPGGVLNPDRNEDDPFGMGGSNKSSKKAYNNLKRSSRKSSRKSKRKSYRKSYRKSSRKAKRW